ncbi:hypothetical protein GCM10007977_026150 [Dactylosporangium sucinum]|uniref:Uncharacterized protein n=1 Tax=Dactylosporangium sucinum TaxID=1424081 RepID=A0A917WRU6_9ACTN|nr:hypothetical protein GCM10007977_026150 [Dactylosporangium sucinum]
MGCSADRRATARRGTVKGMNESPSQAETAYLVSGATLDDESVGPLFAAGF